MRTFEEIFFFQKLDQIDHLKPDIIFTKTYDAIEEVLKKYYGKRTCIISERSLFSFRIRKGGESLKQFVTSLRSLARHCDFGDGLNEPIRDQLVFGNIILHCNKY